MVKTKSVELVTQNHEMSQIEKNEPPLSDKQLVAIPRILAGKSDQAVADELGITRETVWRWRNNDSNFQARLNAERVKILDTACDHLIGLVGKAVACVEQALDSGNAKIALSFLKMIDFGEDLKDPLLYETDPEELKWQKAQQEAKRLFYQVKRHQNALEDPDGFLGRIGGIDMKIYIEACKRFAGKDEQNEGC